MGPRDKADDEDPMAPTPATAPDGTRIDEPPPQALRTPRFATAPGHAEPTAPDHAEPTAPDHAEPTAPDHAEPTAPDHATPAPDSGEPTPSDVPTPHNAAPTTDERSALTVRRSDQALRTAHTPRDELHEPAAPADSEGSEDTLLSAPAPADHFEVNVERRLEETEQRVKQLEAELARIGELRAQGTRPLTQNGLLWIVSLLAVAVAWLLLRAAH